jgi:hypothetical protein
MRTAFVRSIFPAVWPTVIVGGALMLTRQAWPPALPSVLAQMAFGGVLYLALFLVAIGSHDRALYSAKVVELLGRRLAPVT